jgi:SAM-dependent methyltransferase
MDLPDWLASNWQWFDPCHAHGVLWPAADYRPSMDILVAGCGTNQAAVIAYTNPRAKVVAIDVSQPSLNHHAFLKRKYGLDNLELRRLQIEEAKTLDCDFDLIVSTGVLHHLKSPEAGMTALASLLRRDGVAAIMLYARFGRIGVDMMQTIFREMGLKQTDDSLYMVKNLLATLPVDHPIRGYLAIAPDLSYDAGLVDTFLHGRDRNFTVRECIDLVTSAQLVFQDLFMKAPYHAPMFSDSPHDVAIRALGRVEQWSIMERIHFRNACHFFMACRPDRATSSYRIDFSERDATEYQPVLRYRCRLEERWICRSDWKMELSVAQRTVASLADGQRTIGEIADLTRSVGHLSSVDASQEGHRNDVIRLFQSLFQLDFMTMRIKG